MANLVPMMDTGIVDPSMPTRTDGNWMGNEGHRNYTDNMKISVPCMYDAVLPCSPL